MPTKFLVPSVKCKRNRFITIGKKFYRVLDSTSNTIRPKLQLVRFLKMSKPFRCSRCGKEYPRDKEHCRRLYDNRHDFYYYGGYCIWCSRQASAEGLHKNRALRNKQNREWYRRNQVRELKRRRFKYLLHPIFSVAYQTRYRAEHKELVNEKSRMRRERHYDS